MTARWWAFALWALAAGCAVFWGLRLFVPSNPAPAQATVAMAAPPPRGDLARLFGIDAAPPPVAQAEPAPVASRFQLIGVAAPRGPGSGGVALIAVDGKTPRAYRVGAAVDGNTVLQAVRQRGASLGPRGGAANVSLELPPLPPPATGTPGGGAMAAVQPPMPMPAPVPVPSPSFPPGVVPPPAAIITPNGMPPVPTVRPVLPPNLQRTLPNMVPQGDGGVAAQ